MGQHTHVIPANDLIEHEVNEDCVCGPEVEPVATDTGYGYIITHFSLDDRERTQDEYLRKVA